MAVPVSGWWETLVPIPELDANGYLPVGVHACTLHELENRFGRFRTTSRRPELFDRLRTYVKEVGEARVVKAVVIDGSFVTDTDTPNDVDVVLVLAEDHDFGAAILPFEYNALSARRVRKRFGFDVLVARDDSAAYAGCIVFYQQVRGRPGLTKGVLRVEL